KDVAAVLVGIAQDNGEISARLEQAKALAQDGLHCIEVGIVGRQVSEVGRVVGAHVVGGAPVGVAIDVARVIGHRLLEMDVIGRIGADEVERFIGEARAIGEQAEAIAEEKWIGAQGPAALGDDLAIDLHPARVDLDADALAWRLGGLSEAGADQGAANAGKRIEDAAAGLGEELDEGLHQLGRLIGAMGLAQVVAEVRGIGGGDDAFGEEDPLVAGEVIEGVFGMALREAPGASGWWSGGLGGLIWETGEQAWLEGAWHAWRSGGIDHSFYRSEVVL